MTAGFLSEIRLSRVPTQRRSYWDLAIRCEGRCYGMGWAPEFCIDYLTDAGQKWPLPVGGMVLHEFHSLQGMVHNGR